MNEIKQVTTVSPENLQRARKFRNSSHWQRVRRYMLKKSPYCADPFKDHANINRPEMAVQVHHIRPLATHYRLRVTYSNLAPVCTRCHARIEQMERKHQTTAHMFTNC